jgi:hypothetical protein
MVKNVNIWEAWMTSIWKFFELFLQVLCGFEFMSKPKGFADCPEKTLGNLI